MSNFFRNKIYFVFSLVLLGIVSFWIVTLLTPLFDGPSGSGNIPVPAGQRSPFYFGRLGVFVYFTVQVNVIGPIFLLLYSINIKSINRNLFRVVTSYYVLMFIVFWAMLAPFMKWGGYWYNDLSNIVVHGIIPMTFLILFIYDNSKDVNTKRNYLYLLIYPFVYYLMSIVLYFTSEVVIYPFLNFDSPFNASVSPTLVSTILLNINTFLLLLVIISIIYFVISYLESKVIVENTYGETEEIKNVEPVILPKRNLNEPVQTIVTEEKNVKVYNSNDE